MQSTQTILRLDDYGIARFMDKVSKKESGGCWEWTAAIDAHGYGRFGVPGRTRADWRMRLAHRVSYETFVGPIPEGLDLDHLCRVTACVNPEHLEPVSRRENVARQRHRHGSRHMSAVLTEADIPVIREALNAGEMQSSIAARYGVTQGAISKISVGRSWKHVR